MKVTSVNLEHIKSNKKTSDKNSKAASAALPNNHDYLQNSTQKLSSSSIAGYYNITFGGREEQKKWAKMKKDLTPRSEQLLKSSTAVAKKLNSPVVTQDHVYLAILSDLNKYIDELNSGESKYDENQQGTSAFVESYVSPELFKEKKNRDKIQPVIQEEMRSVIKSLKEKTTSYTPAQKGFLSKFNKPELSSSLINDIYYINKQTLAAEPEAGTLIDDSVLTGALLGSQNKKIKSNFFNFLTKIQEATMVDEEPRKEKIHLSFYDSKADNLWKNLDIGKNMFIIYDKGNENASKYLLRSFSNLIKKPGQTYKTMNKDNVDITFFNEKTTFDFLQKKYQAAKKDEGKKHIFVVNWKDIATASSEIRGLSTPAYLLDDLKLLKNEDKDSNVQFLLLSDKDYYYANSANSLIKDAIDDYGVNSLPILNADDTKKILIESPNFVEKVVKKKVDPDAINFAVEVSSSDDGIYPEKTLKLLKNVSSYFINKDEISVDDIKTYTEETKDISVNSKTDEPFKVVFNTGKTLDDIIGSPMTKAEAQSVVNQIKNKKIGTKGMTVFLDNGTSYGGGRRHTAEAIAGEAGIPMITINARDFAMKDIDAMSQNAGLSEIKIQKIINSAKTQAEANPNKTAMIFIEHFDHFGSNPLYGISSIYEQKAFSQLLDEMENIRKNQNLNLLIVGSTDMPDILDQDIMKPHKFLDQIIIYSPQDVKDREDLLKYYTEKNGFKVAGDSEEEQNAIIKSVAETTAGFSVVDLMYMLDKADIIAQERNHDAIQKADFTEAFLQTTTGRVSSAQTSKHSNEMVTKHEGGHALTLQFMYDLQKEQNKPWHIPDKVNFITLDPRGYFGGAMFPKGSENDEYSFEKIFSNIICYYGGHSAEKRFYNMDGSWGISQDLEMATSTAKTAVQSMGLGPNTGRISIQPTKTGHLDISENVRNKIDDDVEVLTKNANAISDMIINTYDGFLEEFGQKYKDRVGTGECIIPGEDFQKELYDWVKRQPQAKKDEIEQLKKDVLDIIEDTKRGKIYTPTEQTSQNSQKIYGPNEGPACSLPNIDE